MAGRFSIEAMFNGRDGVSKTIAQVEGRVKRMSSGVAGSLKEIDKANAKIISGFSDVAKQALAVGALAGGAAGAIGYNVGKTGADFEQAMANVGAVSLMTRGEVADLEKAALELGASTKFSATQVAGGMELMGKAGFTNAQILQGIGPILSAAAAEGAEFEETAGHVSNVLKGMGLETTEAGRVADVLTLASARTNSSISSLGESMANVSSTARQFKIPLEQAVASVALLQDVGLDASTAGSAVNTMLTNMAQPSTKAQASMKALGISFQDAKGDMLPLKDVFAQFEKASKKSGGNMKQVAFFAELVGLRGQKAATNLEKLFSEGKFGDLVKELDGAAGSAKKMADLRMDTLTGDIVTLGNVIDTVKISLFDVNSGALRGIVQSTTAWVTANKDLAKSEFIAFLANARFAIDAFAGGAREGFGAAASALGLFLSPLQRLGMSMVGFETWPFVVRNLGQAFGFLGPVAATFLAFTLAIKAARVATLAYQASVWAVNAAVGIYNFLTGGSAIVTGVNTAAMWAGRVALVAIRIAQLAHTAALTLVAIATGRLTLSTIASSAASVVAAAKTWLLNFAEKARTAAFVLGELATNSFKAATIASTGATEAATTATVAANGSMGAFVATLGAATAAVVALYYAYDQFLKLKDVSGGWEGMKAGIGGVLSGEGYAKGVDDYQNEQARQEAADRGDYRTDYGMPQTSAAAPQVASPAESFYADRPAGPGFYGEVTVRTAPGTSAAVTKPPAGGHQLSVAPSGGM